MTSSAELAAILNLTPQARTVYDHMTKYGNISNMEALISHGISRLSDAVYRIRKAGFFVVSEVKKDATGHGYTRYHLTRG